MNSLTTGGAEVLVGGLSAEFANAGEASLVVALCDAETVGNSAETEARMTADIAAEGGRFVSLGLSARRNPLSGMIALRQVLRTFEPDIVHAHTVRALPMIALARAKAPVVFTHHNTRLPFPPSLFGLVDRMTDLYVAIGHEVETILRRHVGKPIVRIANGAGRSFAAGTVREAPRGPARILSVGAISAQKNYPLLVETARVLRDEGVLGTLPKFRIAGGGAELDGLRGQVDAAGLADHVQFLGERSDVPDLMRESDLYLNVSLYEGMPLTLLEAMASGLPIVATDVPGNRELVSDGENGSKAVLGDPRDLARTIADVLGDPERYRAMSEGSIARSRQFSISETARKHREAYRDLMTGTVGLSQRGSPNRAVNAPQ